MITLAGRLNHDYTANVLIFNNKVEKNRGYLTNTKKFSEVRISQVTVFTSFRLPALTIMWLLRGK